MKQIVPPRGGGLVEALAGQPPRAGHDAGHHPPEKALTVAGLASPVMGPSRCLEDSCPQA